MAVEIYYLLVVKISIEDIIDLVINNYL